MIFSLVLVYQFADLPERFPFAHGISSRIKGWFRLGPEKPDPSSGFELASPEHVLPDADITNEGKDPCGPPPRGPWELNRPPMPADFERYMLASRIWDYCKQNAEKGSKGDSFDLPDSQNNEALNLLMNDHAEEGSGK